MTSSTTVGTPFEARERAPLGGAVLGVADVAHADRHAVARRDDQVLEVRAAVSSRPSVRSELASRSVTLPPGDVRVLRGDRVAHGGDRDVVGGEPVGVEPDVHRALRAPTSRTSPTPGSVRALAHELVGQFGELALRAVGRTSAIVSAGSESRRPCSRSADRRRRAGGAARRDAVADVLRRDVDVAIQPKFASSERRSGLPRSSAARRCRRRC
jgi:hypothetical protein